MKKKLLSVLFILLSIFVVVSCSTDLDEFRVKSKAKLDAHVETLDQYSYREENWTIILNYVEDGKTEIDEAIGASAIDKVVKKYKALINEVSMKANMEETLSFFDLDDPKNIEEVNLEALFFEDRVIVILKKAPTYPVLTEDHFYISNLLSIDYVLQRPGTENPGFRQIITIYLKTHGIEEVLQAIDELNEIEFVKTATPSYIYEIEFN